MEMFRADSSRTGHYVTRGVRRMSGVKWIYSAGSWIVSSPVIVPGANGTVCFGDGDGKMCGLSTDSGEEMWSCRTDGPIVCSAAVESGIVVFGSYDCRVYAAGLSTGELFWRFRTQNSIAASALARSDTARNRNSTCATGLTSIEIVVAGVDGFLYRLDALGRERSRVTIGSPMVSSPALSVTHYSNETTGQPCRASIVITADEDGIVRAVDCDAGTELWRYNVDGSVEATPAVGNGRVYIGSSDGRFYCLDARDGHEKWKYHVRGGIKSSVALYRNLVVFGCLDRNVYAFDAELGYLRWRFACPDRVESSPSAADGTIYVGCDDGNLYAIDAQTGDELWRFGMEGPVRSSPAVWKGIVYAADTAGNVYALY